MLGRRRAGLRLQFLRHEVVNSGIVRKHLTTKAARFLATAKPDPITGESDWVSFDDHPELATNKGSEWSRQNAVKHKGRIWTVEKRHLNDSSSGKIIGMRCSGKPENPLNSRIPSAVRAALKGLPCVQTGTRANVECDHKNGRYNAPADSIEDYQPLCRTSNLVKRGACKQCKATGQRFNATRLNYSVPWLTGGEEFGDDENPKGCVGCFYHDIARFIRESTACPLASESEPGSCPHRPASGAVSGAGASRMKSIQYIGAKSGLIGSLLATFADIHGGETPTSQVTIVDLFCGSGVVTYAAAAAGYHVQSFDSELYARTLAAGATTPYSDEARAAIRLMQDAGSEAASDGLMALEYSPAGPKKRMFWTQLNAAHIDAARQLIAPHSSTLRPFLLASLLVSADAVANTTAVYGAYLKAFKSAALKPMLVAPLHTNPDPAPSGSSILSGHDATSALATLPRRRGLTIVYADPPYNQRQYSANYAPLRVLSEYTDGAVRAETKTGLAKNPYRSPFCSKKEVRRAFQELLTASQLVADYLVLSYSSEGLLSPLELGEILGPHAAREDIQHGRYCSAKKGDASKETVSEFIFVVPLNQAP